MSKQIGAWCVYAAPRGGWLSFIYGTTHLPSVPVQPSVVRDLEYFMVDNKGCIYLVVTDMKCVNGVYQLLVSRRQTQQPPQWVVVTDSDGVPLPIDLNLITFQIWNGEKHVISGKTMTGLDIITNVMWRVTTGETLQGVVQGMYSSLCAN